MLSLTIVTCLEFFTAWSGFLVNETSDGVWDGIIEWRSSLV